MRSGDRTSGRWEGPTWLRVGRRFAAPLLVHRFPPEVPFGFVGRVASSSTPVHVALEAERLPPARALEVVQAARAVAEAELAAGGGGPATPELEVERAAAEELGRALAGRVQELWRTGLRFVANSSSRAGAETARRQLAERLAALGFRTRVPRYETAEALAPLTFARSSGRPRGYWQTLTTDGVGALFPFGDETVLEPGGVLLGLALADASPVFLDRWAHASHSWGIFGTTGSGKSFGAALTVLRTRWLRPETEVLVLDPLGEYSRLVRSLGGTVVRLADPESGRLNPLDLATTAGDRREKAGRVGTMLRALFPSLRDEETALLDAALSREYDRAADGVTFDALRDDLDALGPGAARLATLLEVFRSGSLRGVNGPTTLRVDDPLTAIDLSGIPDDQLPFHLTYLLDWSYHRLARGPGPKLLLLDEAHLVARHEGTTEFLDRLVRHVRHFEAGVLLVTQNPDDFLGRPSGRSLLRNLFAVGLLRLPEVSEASRAFFGLSASEAEWLPRARLPREAGYAESLWRVGGWHLPLALVASTPEFELISAALGARGAEPGSATRSDGGGGL